LGIKGTGFLKVKGFKGLGFCKGFEVFGVRTTKNSSKIPTAE
jgi:hypothetical protein